MTGAHMMNGAEAARTLGIDSQTVRAWVDKGVLPGFRTPGGRLRVHAAAVRKIAGELDAERELLTTGDAAKALGVTLTTIHRWAEDGTLPSKVSVSGARLLFTPAAIEAIKRGRS